MLDPLGSKGCAKNDVMEHDTNESVIATRLDRCISDATHLKKIRDAVEQTHRIVTDGTELIADSSTRPRSTWSCFTTVP